MKKFLSATLAVLLLLQTFSKVWIVIAFKINQEKIVRVFCINRDKPELMCSGKCYLAKKLKADEGQSDKQVPAKCKQLTETTFCFDMPQSFDAEPADAVETRSCPHFYLYAYASVFAERIFDPPEARATV